MVRSCVLRKMLVLVVAVAATVPAAAPTAALNHVAVDLISPSKALAPTGVSWVGLRFQIEPGWHIYWKDPGDSGEPPTVQWNLPAGLKAGAIRWPVPERIPDHTLVDYGYSRSVLLVVPIRVLRPIPAKPPVNVSAIVQYLVCRDVCMPGTAQVRLSLPVSHRASRAPSEWRALFLQARARWPKPAPGRWKIRAFATPRQFILTLHTGSSERRALFFPTDPDVIKNAAPQPATTLVDGVQLKLEKSDLLAKTVSRLEGVIVLEHQGAFAIRVPLHSQTNEGG
jgi:DsbC/DsbD-like thiol-disulfide interchange protein